MKNNNVFLNLKGIEKSFSTVKVLEDVSFSLNKGEILAIVGENGAGKSTLMNILGGVIQKDAGEILLDGHKYEPADPMEAQKSGIAFIHQELNLFSNLTVAENFFIQDLPLKGVFRTVDFKHMRKVAREWTGKLGEDINPNMLIGDLSMGKRQMVEIAKSLAKNARVIIFDEPTTSLSNKEKDKLFEVIRDLAAGGVSIIYISHALEEVFNLCEKIVVIRDGRVTGQEETSKITREKVINLMVGRDMCNLYPYAEKTIGEPLLQVNSLCQGKAFKNVSFQVKAGEIVGMFGLMGAGRSDLANAIFGVKKFDSGSMNIMGEVYHHTTPGLCMRKDMAYITENRREDGLLMTKSVKDNLALACLTDLCTRFNALDTKKEDELTEKAIKDLKIKTHDKKNQAVINLSGGNQQKVVFGKWLATNPRIFIMDEPTRGVDVGAKYEIYTIINELAEEGSGIFMISSEMDELMGICDRILIMSKGEITGELRRDEFMAERMLKCAIGEGIS